MKQATGELNSSIIVMTAVALLTAFFFMVIWPNIKGTLTDRATCANAVCNPGFDSEGFAHCHPPKNTWRGTDTGEILCPYRG